MASPKDMEELERFVRQMAAEQATKKAVAVMDEISTVTDTAWERAKDWLEDEAKRDPKAFRDKYLPTFELPKWQADAMDALMQDAVAKKAKRDTHAKVHTPAKPDPLTGKVQLHGQLVNVFAPQFTVFKFEHRATDNALVVELRREERGLRTKRWLVVIHASKNTRDAWELGDIKELP